MKPDWDKLMLEFKDSTTSLIADVDCTAATGKPLCDSHGVRGFPTIKYGDPNNLEKYEGGRSFSALKDFAEKNLGPQCGPAHMELCDDSKKAMIEGFMKMSDADLAAAVKEKEDVIDKAEKDFTSLVDGLNKEYKEKSDAKDATIVEVKNSGLGLMKSVRAHVSSKSEL